VVVPVTNASERLDLGQGDASVVEVSILRSMAEAFQRDL
jgi:hypothetical protein